jgi:hypothetical protein
VTTRDDLRVLLVAPTGRDAELICHALEAADVQSEILGDVASAVDAFRTQDLGAMLIAEEALEGDAIASFPRRLPSSLRGLSFLSWS